MKTITSYQLIFGVNDTAHFVDQAQKERGKNDISLNQFFDKTESKRKWSIVNPGYILSLAYSYFVFGYEKGMIGQFRLEDYLQKISVIYPDYEQLESDQKTRLLLRRLRNAIAHCRYTVEIRSEDGQIRSDADVWFVFSDKKKDGSDVITIEISLPDFGNIVQAAGESCMKHLQSA